MSVFTTLLKTHYAELIEAYGERLTPDMRHATV